MSKKFDKSSFKTMNELANYGKDLPEIKSIFGDFIPENTLVLFPSERGTGKTFFALQLCMAVSSGMTSFCGQKIDKPGNTLYINCELSEELMARRVYQLYQTAPLEVLNSKYTSKVFTTRSTFAENEIVEHIQAHKPVLVVLDNWTAGFRDLSDDGRRAVSKVMMNLLNIKDSLEFSFVIIDHTRKNTLNLVTDSDLQSGSGAKADLIDCDFFLRRSSQGKRLRLLKRIKSRYSEEQNGAELLNFNESTLWFELQESNVKESEHINQETLQNEPEEQKLKWAKSLKDEGKTYEKISQIVGIPSSTLHRKLKDN